VRFGNGDAAKGWEELCQQAPTNTSNAWREMRSNPAPSPPTPRHHQLKGKFAYGEHRSQSMPCWQIEVTSGGRIWYLLDADNQTVWVTFAGTAHPKATD
jgi:hypothetical protein